MPDKKESFTRRDFIKIAGAAGLGSTLSPFGALNAAHGNTAKAPQGTTVVPMRPYGKTGVKVSMLSLGGVLGMSDQLMFRQAFKMGVTYWDTADSYGFGKNEKAIGKYFAKFPEDRKKIFLVTKSSSVDPEKLTANSFIWDKLGDVYSAKDDITKQLEIIETLHTEIKASDVHNKIIEMASEKDKAIASSLEFSVK